jgi:cytochrome c peroxidase
MKKNIIFIISLTLILLSCSNEQDKKVPKYKQSRYQVSKDEAKLWLLASRVFKPLPEVKIDSSEQALAKFRLGKMLYYEPGLSKNGNISCNSCHSINKFGVDNEPTSPGTDGVRGGRNSPTTLNAALHFVQFWDGRAKDVEEQAQGPILNPIEMGCPSKDWVINKVASNPLYTNLYKVAYPNQKMTYENLTASIGFFERHLITPSRFDAFLNNDFEALNEKEKKGLKLFLENGCQSCHMGVALGGSMYEKIGKYDNYWKYTNSKNIDAGVYELTKKENDKYKFKVPSLRNIAKTYPYFHDGSVNKLSESVRIMAKLQLNKDLSNDEIDAIVAFLESLTGDIPKYAL